MSEFRYLKMDYVDNHKDKQVDIEQVYQLKRIADYIQIIGNIYEKPELLKGDR